MARVTRKTQETATDTPVTETAETTENADSGKGRKSPDFYAAATANIGAGMDLSIPEKKRNVTGGRTNEEYERYVALIKELSEEAIQGHGVGSKQLANRSFLGKYVRSAANTLYRVTHEAGWRNRVLVFKATDTSTPINWRGTDSTLIHEDLYYVGVVIDGLEKTTVEKYATHIQKCQFCNEHAASPDCTRGANLAKKIKEEQNN